MRLLTWNINALAPTVRNAVLKYGCWKGFFEEHQLDIVCLQESKVIEDKLTKELACVDGWQSFWATSREKKGYSGVTTYASEAWAPLSAEADCLQAAEGEEEEEKADLNREGRVVVTDHGTFLLVNVYVPNAGDRPARARLPHKLRFLEALRRKCAELTAGGRELLIVGDFNVPAEPRDMHPALGPFEQHYSAEEVAALRALTDVYPDVWRRLHPEEASTYTVWNEKTSARAFNTGLRIDYVLATPGLLERVVSCEGLSAEAIPPKWSDHAGIVLELRDVDPPPPHPPCAPWQRLHRRFNPPNRIATLFAAGKKRPAAAAAAQEGGSGGGDGAAAAAAAAGDGGPSHSASQGQQQQAAAAQQAGKEEEQQQGQQQEKGGAGKKARTAEGGDGEPADAAGGAQPQAQQPPIAQQQQKGGGGGKASNGGGGKAGNGSGGGKAKPAPGAGQRSIGSFFAKK
ncbi:exodeoxyribonuclease iii [Micractinium conductrix]|uniref:DNA-(apurinic or apyrimidinic site) endonuclease n=1 Tax=Micractinium conductrix TaxID=554055 RepID=A0A2P6VEA8_9CHLO|nr:exodeoxyribonuclease iii [Micractinium conductrix]|eukprot:PSC72426.1 exodeoxyribonuclease iii [Micractinium conductrix]